MTDEKSRKIAMLDAARGRIEAARSTYSFSQFAHVLGVKEHSIWHIIDVGDIRPHAVIEDYQRKPFQEVVDSLRFSDADIEIFKQEIRRRQHEEFKAAYADVYVPDEGPAARGLEIGPGWIGIVSDFCDQLRKFEVDHFVVSLVWAKEKFGALRLFTRDDPSTLTTLQSYWLTRLRERARRQSLRTCQECGQPARLRLGAHAATLCDLHKHLVGDLRADDGVILDPDRTDQSEPPTWTDAELGLDEGESMDLAKQIELDCRPFLDPDLKLDGTDKDLADLRRKLIAVDRAIGRYHEIKFQLRQRGYEIAIEHPRSMATVDEIKRDAIVAEIEMIMRGEQNWTDVANDELIDYTRTLEFLAGHMMGPGCSVFLSPAQFDRLKVYLSHIDRLVPKANFALEQCIDHRPSGYSVAWDNDGTAYEDDLIDTIMEQLTQSMGFYAGSIIREGYLIDLDDIDQQIAEIRERVAKKHNI
ncbi:hypothetical protein O9X99_02130 [Agrobacterium salinitolerans]|uniref:Uncharacterized protein n=1 Tax=Agrobacterium salinitolerans TaxID=1183413 RepID=A0ABY3BUP4_9HYPH|nr:MULTISPECIES: hypothetical protein [Agrobacterium]MCZ7890466.1 hypothetical protein [Agrobacterium salinitolerans]TRA96812.1 hypothetical protein EXN23_00825 [Agrobacterium salinitolerans]